VGPGGYVYVCVCVCVCRTRATQKHTHTRIGRPRIVVFLLSLPFPHNFCKRKTRGRRANKTFVKTEDGKRRQRRRFTGKIEALRPPLSLRNLVSRAQVQNAGTYETGRSAQKLPPSSTSFSPKEASGKGVRKGCM